MSWIKTSERLPEFNVRVFIISNSGYEHVAELYQDHSGKAFDWTVYNGREPQQEYVLRQVEYWMPIPELPSE